MRKLFLFLCFFFIVAGASAQNARMRVLTGKTVDAQDDSPIPGVNVQVVSLADTTRPTGNITDGEGNFRIPISAAGRYRVRYSYVGYQTKTDTVQVGNGIVNVGKIGLRLSTVNLDQVTVTGVQERVVLKGDTTQYNAQAFKVNKDASAEDLIAKMPGVVVQDGKVQAQGEDVQRVMVDGREFFGQDPAATLKNLPAEIVDKIQVYDRQNDQAQFTGFNDGNTEKTINIITRNGRSNGQFGKIYGGFGSEEHYIAGGNINIFQGNRRISIIGMSNNVNQQNFSFEDILGVTGNTGGGMMGGNMMRGAGGPPGGGRPSGGGGGRPSGGGGGGFDRGGIGNFMVNNQGGITTTHAVGINYNDQFGKKLKVTGSYFFNMSGNSNRSLVDRTYLLEGSESQNYLQRDTSNSDNYNHRVNMRLEYTINQNNSLLITPRLSSQNNSSDSGLDGRYLLPIGDPFSTTVNEYNSQNQGFQASTGILYRHRFGKAGRTISSELNISRNDRTGDTDQASRNWYYFVVEGETSQEEYQRRTDSEQNGTTYGVNLAYTEPVGKKGQLQINYNPSFNNNLSDRLTNQLDPTTGNYNQLLETLSSRFDNNVTTQRGGLTYQHQIGKMRVSAGVSAQEVRLSGDQTYPIAFDLSRSFTNWLPTANIEWEWSRTKRFNIFYRTQTDVPSINQLQSVVDASNTLFMSTGNPDLKQSYSHNIMARMHMMNPQAGRMAMLFVMFQKSNNYIGNATFVANRDSVIGPGVTLASGSQLSKPVNMDGYTNARSFFTVGMPIGFVKSNVNLNGGFGYSRTPGILNGQSNVADVWNYNGGITVGSNVSERVDFTLSYFATYNDASYSLRSDQNRTFWRHAASGRIQVSPIEPLVLETNVVMSRYAGEGVSSDQNAMIWNAGLGYKFLRQNSGELRLVVNDILNKDKSINRAITDLYIEDSQGIVLGRYILLNFTYRLRNFKM